MSHIEISDDFVQARGGSKQIKLLPIQGDEIINKRPVNNTIGNDSYIVTDENKRQWRVKSGEVKGTPAFDITGYYKRVVQIRTSYYTGKRYSVSDSFTDIDGNYYEALPSCAIKNGDDIYLYCPPHIRD